MRTILGYAGVDRGAKASYAITEPCNNKSTTRSLPRALSPLRCRQNRKRAMIAWPIPLLAAILRATVGTMECLIPIVLVWPLAWVATNRADHVVPIFCHASQAGEAFSLHHQA